MSSEVGAMIAFGVIALLILFIGWRKGFFHFEEKPWVVPINLVQLIGAFAIYFLGTYLLTAIGMSIWKKNFVTNYLAVTCLLSFGISFAIFILLGVYLGIMPKAVRRGILRRENVDHPLIEDVWTAFYAWIMAFPLVLFLSQALEMLVTKVFGITELPDQIAVKFLKSTLLFCK